MATPDYSKRPDDPNEDSSVDAASLASQEAQNQARQASLSQAVSQDGEQTNPSQATSATGATNDDALYVDTYQGLQQHRLEDHQFLRSVRKLQKADRKAKTPEEQFKVDQDVVSLMMDHYGPKNDADPKGHQDALANTLSAIDKTSSHDVLSNAAQQSTVSLNSTRRRMNQINNYLTAKSNDQNNVDQLKQNADRYLFHDPKLGADSQTIMKYRPGNEFDTGVTTEQTSSAAAKQAQPSSEVNKMGIKTRVKTAAKTFWEEYTKAANKFDQNIRDTRTDLHNDVHNLVNEDHAMHKDPKYRQANTQYDKNLDSEIKYQDRLEQLGSKAANVDTNYAYDEVTNDVTSTVANHRFKDPTKEQIAGIKAEVQKRGPQSVVVDEMDHSREREERTFVKQNSVLTYLNKSNPTAEDKTLADQAIDHDKLANPDQARSQASFLGFNPDYHADLAQYYQAHDSQATSAEAPATSATSTSAAAISDNEASTSSAASKASKAAHENAEVSGQSIHEQTTAASSASHDPSDQVDLSHKDVGVNRTQISTGDHGEGIESSKNPNGQSTMDASVEKDAAQNNKKLVDDKSSDRAAETAFNVNTASNDAIKEQIAKMQQELKDSKERDQLLNDYDASAKKLGRPTSKRSFMSKLKDSWQRSQNKDMEQTKGSIFIHRAMRGGAVTLKTAGRLALAGAVLMAGTVKAGAKALRKASSSITKSVDKSVVNGFAPGDVKQSDIQK